MWVTYRHATQHHRPNARSKNSEKNPKIITGMIKTGVTCDQEKQRKAPEGHGRDDEHNPTRKRVLHGDTQETTKRFLPVET